MAKSSGGGEGSAKAGDYVYIAGPVGVQISAEVRGVSRSGYTVQALQGYGGRGNTYFVPRKGARVRVMNERERGFF